MRQRKDRRMRWRLWLRFGRASPETATTPAVALSACRRGGDNQPNQPNPSAKRWGLLRLSEMRRRLQFACATACKTENG